MSDTCTRGWNAAIVDRNRVRHKSSPNGSNARLFLCTSRSLQCLACVALAEFSFFYFSDDGVRVTLLVSTRVEFRAVSERSVFQQKPYFMKKFNGLRRDSC